MRDFLHFFSVPAVLLTGCLFLSACTGEDVMLTLELVGDFADIFAADTETTTEAKQRCFSVVDDTARLDCETRYDNTFTPSNEQ